MDEIELNALIISLIIPEIKRRESNNLNSFIVNFSQSSKKYYVLDDTKTLLSYVCEEIEKYVKKSYDDNNDLFSEIKSYIQKNKPSHKVEMSYEKFITIIRDLFDDKSFDWIKLPHSDISLESLLFYYQNKNN